MIKTYGYNGVVPGPVLRLKEGQQVSINVVNDTDIDDIIHWHGLFVPSEVDGAMEEGSPMVPAHGGSKVYTFTPKPTGTRWYHSHDVDFVGSASPASAKSPPQSAPTHH